MHFVGLAAGGGTAGGVPTVVPAGEVIVLADKLSHLTDTRVIVAGRLIVDGLLRLINRPREPEVLKLVSAVQTLPATCLVPVDADAGPFTLLLKNKGTPGDVVELYSISDAAVPPVITIGGNGPLIDGNGSVTLTTPRERLRLRRQLGQQWNVVI